MANLGHPTGLRRVCFIVYNSKTLNDDDDNDDYDDDDDDDDDDDGVFLAEDQRQFITDEEGPQKPDENEYVALVEDTVRLRHRISSGSDGSTMFELSNFSSDVSLYLSKSLNFGLDKTSSQF